jgi:hypothetical protein
MAFINQPPLLRGSFFKHSKWKVAKKYFGFDCMPKLFCHYIGQNKRFKATIYLLD